MTGRREVLARLAAFVAALSPEARAAWHRAAFEADSVPDLARALGAPPPAPSPGVSVTAPHFTHEGTSVPVVVASSLPGVRRLLLLVEESPWALCAIYEFGPQVEPRVMTRVKMNRSSRLVAIAQTADGRLHIARCQVHLALGQVD